MLAELAAPRSDRLISESTPPAAHRLIAWRAARQRAGAINDLWYKNAVIYCLSVGTFMDANGDGIGDFQGLMRRLDYLHGLGVTAIWLMPFQTSPSATTATTSPTTTASIRATARSATSSSSRTAPSSAASASSSTWWSTTPRTSTRGSRRRGATPSSKYRDWYVWSKKKPADADEGMVFPGVQKSTWSYDKQAQAPGTSTASTTSSRTSTPSNPQVQAEILKIMGFWIQLGVSGFRMDAVPFIIAHQGRRREEAGRAIRHAARRFREFLQWRQGDCIILAEANVLPETDMEYFGDDGDRMHMMFNFQVNQHLFYALAAADARPLVKALQATKPRPATAQWGLFLRNHDELDLGRLDRGAAADRSSPPSDPSKDMQLYERGIRRRLAPMLDGDRRRLELAYSLLFTLPGHAGHPLRRRDRHGRRPVAARTQLRAHADAMVDRAARRLHQARQARSCR